MNTYDIINRLRRYPSVGMPGDGIFDDGAFQRALNNIEGYIPNVKALAQSIRDLTTEGNNLSAGLESLSILQAGMNAEFLKGVKSATFLLEREKDLTKAFGLTAKASALLSAEYSKTAQEIGISDELMNKYRMSINKILPGMSANLKRTGDYGKSLLKTNDFLQQHIGLTDDQTNSLTLAAAATGTDLETSVNNTAKFAKEYEKATGEVGVFKDLMESVANTSIELRSEYSKFPGSLEVATLKARRLGMSMADIDKSATSLLDIESSVGKELEYQLISGKRLVDASGNSLTNKLREAKLAGDAVGQANAMTEILTSQSDIIEHGNYLQKQALADAMGLTAEQLVGANAQMKLQEQIYQKMKDANELNVNGREIKSAVELTTDDIQAGMDKFGQTMTDTERKTAIANLKAQESLLTPAQQQVDLLQQIVNKGIRVITGKGDYAAKLDEMVSKIDTSRGRMEAGTEYLRQPAAAFGKSQTISGMATGMVDEIKKYADAITGSPIVTPLITAASMVVKGVITQAHGTKVQGEATDNTVKNEDAFMMHDGIIKFDDRDKFTMIASPYGAMHESVADKITGASYGGNSGLDANAIAKAIQSAIQAGLSNVSWAVNLDPMAVDKAIKFNSGRLNS